MIKKYALNNAKGNAPKNGYKIRIGNEIFWTIDKRAARRFMDETWAKQEQPEPAYVYHITAMFTEALMFKYVLERK